MDAFYASVELLGRPQLRGRPVIVGSTSTRGVVLSATYEARHYGVHSAMPMGRARRLCPQAVVIPPSRESYARVSAGVLEIFQSVTPLVEPLALDEAFLDVSGALRRLGRPAAIGELIRSRVATELGITCSVGVASTKFVAKLASAQCKPDGLFVVARDEASVIGFLHPLPIGALWGVGDRTEQALARLGLRTIGDVAQAPPAMLRHELGSAAGTALAALAWGRDERTVVAGEPDKSIGSEQTFERDIDDPRVIRRELLRLSERTAARLRSAGQVTRTVSIKLRSADFTTITRSRTLPDPTDVGYEIYATARALYSSAGSGHVRLRLVGVRAENLSDAATSPRQLTFDEPAAGWREAERAIDRAASRFGPDIVRPASLVTSEERPRE